MGSISKGKPIKFEEMETPLYFSLMGGFIYQWCCDCGARHIWHIEIIEEGDKNYIKVACAMYKQATKFKMKTLLISLTIAFILCVIFWLAATMIFWANL